VLSSASACTQTSILPAARTALSMARAGALPPRFGDVHPVFLNPDFGTLVMGGVSMLWFLGLSLLSEHLLDDSILALGLSIAFYYALTSFACVALFREQLFLSAGNFVCMGLLPAAGGLMMAALFGLSCVSLATAGATTIFGIGGPLVIGAGSLLVGIVPMLLVRQRMPAFFTRTASTAMAR